jgi:hypothetical protein
VTVQAVVFGRVQRVRGNTKRVQTNSSSEWENGRAHGMGNQMGRRRVGL